MQETLQRRWLAAHAAAGQAIDWINDVRGSAPRLDSEADALILELRRARNLAHSLQRVSATPMTIGFFGLSQAGKSYLISSLAAGSNGKLETVYGGQRLDFIAHVNPVGGGKEATGLVTRFSRTAQSGPNDFPVELKLFSEIEIAKILANAYFKDFDQERVEYEITEARIDALLARFEDRQGGSQHSGVTSDDVVSLWDYLGHSFEKSVRKLEFAYWPRVCALAPLLAPDERAELFSVLWGEQAELTRVYAQLASSLRKLGNAPTAFAPLTALIKPAGDGSFSQADSIMNVDILERLGSSRDHSIEVRPSLGEQLQAPASVQISHLAALTAELIFPLVESTRDPRVEKVDLLDFPGYRGRLKLQSLSRAADSSSGDKGNPAAQLILRGKVAYLFERYTDNQEMNGLVLCTSTDKQSDVEDVAPVLTRWVDSTQGATPQARGGRRPGLLWAMTMFDKRISGALQQPKSQLDEGWEGLVKMTMLERFGNEDWMKKWANGPFDNTYLVRKPRMPVAFLDLEQGSEARINASYSDQLYLMRETFTQSPSVRLHVADPAAAWDAMASLNDGGMTRLAEYVGSIATLDFKLARIEEQLSQKILQPVVEARLKPLYHQDGADEADKKKVIATKLWQDLGRIRVLLPELLSKLELSSEDLRNLYLSGADSAAVPEVQDEDGQEAAPASEDPFGALLGSGDGFDIDPFATEATAAPAAATATATLQTAEHRFARAAFQAWVAHLRQLPARSQLLRLLRIEKPTAESLVDELITAANRLDIPAQMEAALIRRGDGSTTRELMASRQVLRVQTVLRDFIAWLGYLQTPLSARPRSLIDRKDPLFTEVAVLGKDDLPQLPVAAVDHNREFMGHWLSGLTMMTRENAGHSAGREITIEQNEALGRVLARFEE